MTIAGNICAALAAVALLILFAVMATSKNSLEIQYTAILLSIPMFLLFAGAYSAIVATGRLDWLNWPRGGQYLGVLTSCLSLCVIMCGAVALRSEPADQIPLGLRLFIPWAGVVVPLLLLSIALVWLNVPDATWIRSAFSVLSAIGLITGVVLLGEAFYWMQKRDMARVEAIQDRESARDQMIMAQVQAADPAKDFGSLLAQSSKFESPKIRELAVQKLLSNGPNFTALLITQLHNVYCGDALTYLRDNDPPDPAALAEPIREGLLKVAADVRERVRDESTIRPDDFQYDTQRVLSVAEKYAKYGVDYVPAVREYRAALDEKRPGGEVVRIDARKTVDDWLARKR